MDAQNRSGYGIAAAGGVVWRDAGRGRVEVAISTATDMTTGRCPRASCGQARPSCWARFARSGEEIGSRVAVQRRLGRGGYRVARESKSVAFWSMQHRGGHFESSQEVDRMSWVDPGRGPRPAQLPLDRGDARPFRRDAGTGLRRHRASSCKGRQTCELAGRRHASARWRTKVAGQSRRLARLLPCFAPGADRFSRPSPLRADRRADRRVPRIADRDPFGVFGRGLLGRSGPSGQRSARSWSRLNHRRCCAAKEKRFPRCWKP